MDRRFLHPSGTQLCGFRGWGSRELTLVDPVLADPAVDGRVGDWTYQMDQFQGSRSRGRLPDIFARFQKAVAERFSPLALIDALLSGISARQLLVVGLACAPAANRGRLGHGLSAVGHPSTVR